MVKISIDITYKPIKEAIDQVKDGLNNTSTIMRAVSLRMKKMIRTHFDKEEDSSGEAWTPLRPATIANRRRGKKGIGAGRIRAMYKAMYRAKGIEVAGITFGDRSMSIRVKILQDTGHLRDSIFPRHTRDTAVVGTNVKYAATHQFGRKGGGWQKSDIPAREFLYINDEEFDVLENLIGRFIFDGDRLSYQ